VPEWLHIWTPSIHDEVLLGLLLLFLVMIMMIMTMSMILTTLSQVVELNWSNQQYQDVHGTRITLVNNTFVPQGQPFPPEAQVPLARGVGGACVASLCCK